MKAKLTKSVIDKIPFSNDGRLMLIDTELKGFGCRVGKSSKVYFAEKRVNGKPVRVTIGKHGQITPEQAREEAKAILGQMSGRAAMNPNEEKKQERIKGITLAEALEEFKRARSYLKARTIKDYEYALQKYFSDWRGKPLTAITREMVDSRHKLIGNGNGGAAQANQAMRFLRSLYNYAIGKYGREVVSVNPVEGLTLTRSWFKVKRKQSIIRPHELPALFEALEKMIAESPYESTRTFREKVS